MEKNYTDEHTSGSNRIKNFFTIAISFLVGMTVALYFVPGRKQGLSSMQSNKLDEVVKYINSYYVDTVNTNQLFETAITSMLQELDPHSTYANASDNKAMMESLEGAFEGVGIQFSIMNDTIMVISTVSGGPSEKQGIRAGDRIVTVDGKNVAGIGIQNDEVMKMLRGKKKTDVTIGIMRQGYPQITDYTVTRDVIPTYTLDIAYMVDPQTGYIKINQFGATTANEFSDAIAKLKKKGMSKMILDLRSNSGGFLDAAILNPFFVIVLTPLILIAFGALARRGKDISTPRKIAMGMGIAATAYLIMTIFSASCGYPSAEEFRTTGTEAEKAGWWILIIYYFFMTVAELFISPLGLSFVSKVAPKHLLGLCQGLWLGATAVGNGLLWIGPLMYNKWPIWQCWAVFMGVCLISMGVMLSLKSLPT